MQMVTVVGLLVAVANLVVCSATHAGILPKVEEAPVVAAFDIPDKVVEKLEDKDTLDIDLSKIWSSLAEMVGLTKMYKDDMLKQQLLSEYYDLDKGREDDSGGSGNFIQDTSPPLLPPTTDVDNVTFSQETLRRIKRQTKRLNIPIPTRQGHLRGGDDIPPDQCDRDEVLVPGKDSDECYQLLSQGPCEDNEYIILDPDTKKGFCAPRLCSPDRVFVFGDQLCHDPREAGICPPGRMLFTTSYGTPMCGCPDGTYEEDDDLDDDVCEPVLGQIKNCPPGEVFWFSDFRRPPECRPDPCRGQNLDRGPKDLPYVPSVFDGKCYKIGSRPHFCRSDEFYSISLELLRGVCSSLEEAGYLVLDSDEINAFVQQYGNLLDRDSTKLSKPSKGRPSTKITPAGTTLLKIPEVGAPVMEMDDDEELSPLTVGQSVVVANHHPVINEVDPTQHLIALLPTHMNAFSPPLISVNGSISFLGFIGGLVPLRNPTVAGHHHRGRRSPLPFASPGNVFEPGLSGCVAGARRGANAKCRGTILPSRFPPSRPRRSTPPVPPRPSCGGLWGLNRRCGSGSSSGIASSINALGLG